jgi:cytochrome c oxidase subunit 2
MMRTAFSGVETPGQPAGGRTVMPRVPTLPFVPPEASTSAGDIDLLALGITIICGLFGLGICFFIVYFGVKYRQGHAVDRSHAPLSSVPIEIAWTFIPLALLIAIYAWAAGVFLSLKRVPAGATEIYGSAKQWMWKFQHPEGRWENDALHLPVGRPVILKMTSTDVIHSFFVPAFRLHQDVVPGEYSTVWFTPNRIGMYHLFCAQFCGTFHSGMTGTVTVMDAADYQRWLQSGPETQSIAAAGAALFQAHGCSGCHMGGSVRAPRLDGIYDKPVAVQIPPPGATGNALIAALQHTPARTMIADDLYLHDSVVFPEKEIAAGDLPVMPSFRGQLSEEEIYKIIAVIKSLGTRNQPGSGRPLAQTRTLSAAEYRARTGFTPSNLKQLPGAK